MKHLKRICETGTRAKSWCKKGSSQTKEEIWVTEDYQEAPVVFFPLKGSGTKKKWITWSYVLYSCLDWAEAPQFQIGSMT